MSSEADDLRADTFDTPVWLRPEPGSRRPRFSRAKIAEAALRIADREGIRAVSMRRVAEELEAGTMTLYHYVRTKSELLSLLSDAVMGELILEPEELSGSWRESLSAIARRSRRAFDRHPWVFDTAGLPGIGPNGVRHFEQSLEAVASLGLDISDRLDIIELVDEYVFGYCFAQRDRQDFVQMNQTDRDDLFDYVEQITKEGGYPEIDVLMQGYTRETFWQQMQERAASDRFERNLGRLLDGIEMSLSRRRE